MQTPPKKGRDIIPDILSPKMTRAFWRQNNFNINKPAPLGAKLLGAFHWKCSTPFILDPLLWIGSAYSFVYLNSCL